MGRDRILRDERSPPPRVRPLPFLQQGLQNLFPWSWITSNEHPIIERVRFLCSNIVINSNGVYLRPVQSITVFIIIGLCEFRRRLTGLHHPLKSTVVPYIIRG